MTTTAEVVDAYLDAQRDVLTRDVRVLDDAEAVHQTRVAARRYRSMLHVFADLFVSADAARLDEELAWYAGLLGDLRDLHVLRDAMAAAIAELADELDIDVGPVSERVDQELRARERRARRRLRAAYVSRRYERLIADLVGAAPVADGGQPLAAYLATADKKARRRSHRAERRDAADPRRDPELHSARKAAKRARYTAEAAAPVLGKSAKKAARKWRSRQDRLGEHQDAIVAGRFLRDLVQGEADFALGVLWARERQL